MGLRKDKDFSKKNIHPWTDGQHSGIADQNLLYLLFLIPMHRRPDIYTDSSDVRGRKETVLYFSVQTDGGQNSANCLEDLKPINQKIIFNFI